MKTVNADFLTNRRYKDLKQNHTQNLCKFAENVSIPLCSFKIFSLAIHSNYTLVQIRYQRQILDTLFSNINTLSQIFCALMML